MTPHQTDNVFQFERQFQIRRSRRVELLGVPLNSGQRLPPERLIEHGPDELEPVDSDLLRIQCPGLIHRTDAADRGLF